MTLTLRYIVGRRSLSNMHFARSVVRSWFKSYDKKGWYFYITFMRLLCRKKATPCMTLALIYVFKDMTLSNFSLKLNRRSLFIKKLLEKDGTPVLIVFEVYFEGGGR